MLSDTSEAPQAVSIGLRNCYLARCSFRRPFAALPWVLPRPTSCFCWASKLLSGTSEAPQAVSIGLQNCYLARLQHPLKTLPAAFDGLSLLCHGSSRGPTSCFCWASKMLSDTSEAPQAVCIGLRNCYLARFQHPLKASKPSKPSQQLSTAFAALPWVLPRPHELFLLGFETAIWPFRSATRCFYWVSKLLSGTLQLSTAFRCFAMGPPEAPQAVSVGLRTAIWHFRSATSCLYWASKLLSGTFSAPLKSLKTLKTLPAAFDGLSLLCHGSSRGPTSCFCWASKLLSGPSEAPQDVSIGFRNCYLARFQHPLKASKPSKPSKPSQQLSTAFRCFAMGPPEAPQAVSVGLGNYYLALPKRHKLFLLGFETAIWHVFSAP